MHVQMRTKLVPGCNTCSMAQALAMATTLSVEQWLLYATAAVEGHAASIGHAAVD